MQEPVVEPPKVERRLEPEGLGPVSGARVDGEAVGVTSVRSRVGRAGGYDEVLRGSRGKAAGERAGHPSRRAVCGERGNRHRSARRSGQPGRLRAGASSADALVAGRSRRSGPRPGKPVTWPRAAASSQCRCWKVRRSLVNTGAPGTVDDRIRVLKIQAKLHRWAGEDAARRSDNLVVDPAVLAVAWARVRGQPGSAPPGGRHDRQLHRIRARGGAVRHRLAGRIKGPPVHPAAGSGMDDPQVERETASAGHPDRPGPGRPGGAQTGPGNRSSRPTSSRVRTASGFGIGRRMPTVRFIS
jgi:hypothetical protein